MTQNALAKERREVKQQQREAQEDTIPKDIGKLWVDPVPEGMFATAVGFFAISEFYFCDPSSGGQAVFMVIVSKDFSHADPSWTT